MSQDTPIELDAAARAEALSYKLRKEAFVSNLSGSSLSDINLVTLVAASAVLLWASLARQGIVSSSLSFPGIALDFLLSICVILFEFTIYSSDPKFWNFQLILPTIIIQASFLFQQKRRTKRDAGRAGPQKSSGGSTNSLDSARSEKTIESERHLQAGTLINRPFLTNYRGALLIATCLAILAVDFPIFPRRFAKVETWGTSLMDLGVGNFVFSAGIVGARPVIRDEQRAATRSGTIRFNFAGRMFGALRHSLPLLVLGVARLLSVKNLDYAEHVTEYGVHWNFFFTLALLPPFVEAVDCCLAVLKSYSPTSGPNSSANKSPGISIRYDFVAILIAAIYEIILNNTSLLSFILISPRTPESSFLSKNREGVFSFTGYLAIFLAGRSTGILVCQFHLPQPSIKQKRVSPSKTEQALIWTERLRVVLPQLLIRAAIYSTIYILTTNVYALNLSVSRRLANLPYVLWVIAYNNAQLFLFAIAEGLGLKFTHVNHSHDQGISEDDNENVVKAEEVPSPIMRAFNKNGLAVFLVANLLTGLVNLSMNTLDMGDFAALGVLSAYAGAVTLVAVLMNVYGIKVKL